MGQEARVKTNGAEKCAGLGKALHSAALAMRLRWLFPQDVKR
jgi:hypothetical protein